MLAGAPCAWQMVDARAPSRSRAAGPRGRQARRHVVGLRTAGHRHQAGQRPAPAAGRGHRRPRRRPCRRPAPATPPTARPSSSGLLTTNLGPGRDKLLLRGLSDGAYTGRARSTVATYLDDIPINYNAPDPDLRLVDVERVEIAARAAGRALRLRLPQRRLPHRHRQARPRALRGPSCAPTGAVTDGGAPSGVGEATSTARSGAASRACGCRPTTTWRAATSTT